MLIELGKVQVVNDDLDLVKGTPWREELHPRGKDGKFSSIRGGSKVVAKNGTKGKVTQVTDTHYHIEKEDGKTSKILKDNVIHEKDHTELTKKKKTAKKPASKTKKGAGKSATTKKAGTKPKATPTGKKSGASAGRAPSTKPATTSKPSTAKSGKSKTTKGAKKASEEQKVTKPAPKKKATAKKAPAKKTSKKDIRSDSQKNRELAYDAGEKIGGARKDMWEQSFKADPNQKTLADLEKDNPAVAEKLAVKKNILPPFSFEDEHKNGVDLPTAILKKLIYDRIAPKPDGDTPEARKEYVNGINKVQRHFAGIKSLEQMKNAIREFADIAHKGKRGREAEETLNKYKDGTSRYSYLNTELYEKYLEEGKPARAFMDFSSMGDKFEGFFTSYKSRESTFKTVQKNMKEGWDKYLNPETKAKNGGTPKGGENKKWERKAEAEHLRKGGKPTKVAKPEDLMNDFGVRGVEFGHWVNDSSGKYHLQRCAEAFNDLADTVGIDPKDISLNGRLAIAFGARGKGGALAHYEPDRKVINMTKYGGAGSLAHEWGHAMDNILYQYSNGGQESLGLASEHATRMGDTDPKLKALYENLMDAIRKPAPGDKGGTKKITLDSSVKPPSNYYPEMRRDVNGGMSPEEVYHKWSEKLAGKYDRYIEATKNNSLRSPQDRDKQVKKYEGQKKRELNKLNSYIAQELRYKQNGGYGGDHYKGEIEVSTGQSEYYTRMQEVDGSGKAYFAQGAEMFARVFESYVQHKLDKEGRHNNYLVHSTREKDVNNFEAPFPKGKERTHMFKAMENLMKHVSKGKALKKALEMELLKSFDSQGTMQKVTLDELLGSIHSNNLNAQFRKNRSAYNVKDPSEVIYIPVNRLTTPHQTEKATDFDKVHENVNRMKRGENLEPIVIGFDHDVHDGHHRLDATKIMDYTHVPCVVMQTPNEIERQRAIEAYQEIWKSFHYPQHNHHHQHHEKGDRPRLFNEEELKQLGKEAFEDNENYMYRGIGQRELDFIRKNGFVQSKGKGNDADKNNSYTCFSTLYSQAEGYARSNYDLYNEKQAYIIALPKPDHLRAVDGEIVAKGKITSEGMLVLPIPKEIR